MQLNRIVRFCTNSFQKYFNVPKYSFGSSPPEKQSRHMVLLTNIRKILIQENEKVDISKQTMTLEDLSSYELNNYYKAFGSNFKDFVRESLNAKEESEVNIIKEGRIALFCKEISDSNKKIEWEQTLIYHPSFIFDRDFSSLVVKTYAEQLAEQFAEEKKEYRGLRILDAIASSGIRTMRYIKEIDPSLIQEIHSAEMDEDAVKLMLLNLELNQIPETKVRVIHDDPNSTMFNRVYYQPKDSSEKFFRYNVIDLDIHGSPVQYFDTAMQAIADGGLICATFLDMRVLGGADIEKCFYHYGSSRTRLESYKENGIRIALYTANTIANKYGKYIKPMLSYHGDFYQRLFFTVHNSKNECAKSMEKYSNVYTCQSCGNYHLHPLGKIEGKYFIANPLEQNFGKCDQCSSPTTMNGPIWNGRLNHRDFIYKMIESARDPRSNIKFHSENSIQELLKAIIQEERLPMTPLSFDFPMSCSFLKTVSPNKMALLSALKQNGYYITNSYISPTQWKTNAPVDFLIDFMREWKKRLIASSNANSTEESNYLSYFLQKPSKHRIHLDFQHVRLPNHSNKFYKSFKNLNQSNPQKDVMPRYKKPSPRRT